MKMILSFHLAFFQIPTAQYGAVSVAGSGELENGVITVDLEFTVVLDGQVGTFGVFEEQLVLPEAMPTE